MLHRLCWSNKICNHDSFFQNFFVYVSYVFFFNHFNSFFRKIMFYWLSVVARASWSFWNIWLVYTRKKLLFLLKLILFASPVFDSILKKNRFKTKVWSLVRVSMNYWIYFHILLFFFNFYFPVPRRSPTAVHFFHLITLFKQSLNDWVT